MFSLDGPRPKLLLKFENKNEAYLLAVRLRFRSAGSLTFCMCFFPDDGWRYTMSFINAAGTPAIDLLLQLGPATTFFYTKISSFLFDLLLYRSCYWLLYT